MAVALPVLERNADTEEKKFTREYRDTFMSAEERHNSRISENYARLINPESRPRDIIAPSHPIAEENFEEAKIAHTENISSAREAIINRPYLVENARADADIFRADSPINRRTIETIEAAASSQTDEEENEDLRPTQTTIQYKTTGVKKTVEEGKIETKPAVSKRFALTKKDRIIIAVALTVIIALFVLIIVNSAVISKLNSDVSSLQTTLNEAESVYNEALADKTEYLEESNLFQVVSDFALNNGMVLR